MAEIPEFLVLQVLLRSGGRCECTAGNHSHGSRCFASIRKNNRYRGFEGLGGWELVTEDTSGPPSMDNIKVTCLDCFKKLSP